MFTRGEFIYQDEAYGTLVSHTKEETIIELILGGTLVSAFKHTLSGDFSFNSNKAKALYDILKEGFSGCKAKNGVSYPCESGAMTRHEFEKKGNSYIIDICMNELHSCTILGTKCRVLLNYDPTGFIVPEGVSWVSLKRNRAKALKAEDDFNVTETEEIVVRSVEEIALDKEDITWLKNKKYYVVNDEETAERIFSYLDNYNGVIAYDTETTGLKINCFGKINSKYSKDLAKWNSEHPDDQVRADSLVGIIYCIEKDVSYYFPAKNRKFKNLYEDKDNVYRKAIIERTKAEYTVGKYKDLDTDMARYVRDTPGDEWTPDVVLMMRNKHILETRHLVGHNGPFDWKVGWLYEIDSNFKDDTMVMHQLMYKFRSTTANKGESSSLKRLAKVELGIDQWELSDFFPDYKEDKGDAFRASNSKKKKKKKGTNSKIDFSYMTLEGARIYAPCDGDVTFQLMMKYKTDMIKNHKDLEYLYSVEVIVGIAIGYMEFYGHRIDESKIYSARLSTMAKRAMYKSQLRQEINFCGADELAAYNQLKDVASKLEEHQDSDKDTRDSLTGDVLACIDSLDEAINKDTEHVINLDSPPQMARLFFDDLQIPLDNIKRSVDKKTVKSILNIKNEDGSLKYPVVKIYSDYKQAESLLSKFFDNLPYFMYPGGYIFSSYGQISTATGRMSCQKPNAQQYPKDITKIVVPREGYVMLDADYSQIEYRVLVALAKSKKLAALFSDPDSDYHTLMASLMFGVPYESVTPAMRSDAKAFNFGIPYGMGFRSLAIRLHNVANDETIQDAKDKYELYFKDQPEVRSFFEHVKEQAQVNGYTRTFWNRKRFYNFTNSEGSIDNAKKAAALRQAGNAVIQGCLDGDTRIRTKEYGSVRIKDVVDQTLQVWDGDKWSLGDILYSGKKRKCIIKFSNGQEFICSPTHKFLAINRKGNRGFIECKELATIETSRNPHRIAVDSAYEEESGFKCAEYMEFGRVIVPESVEITDEYIDMYDVCNTDGGRYVADGIVTHNTAADIFKISVARNFMYIRENGLLGDLLIINMIHDEQLMEVNVETLNLERILRDVGINMQFSVEGFPPLYIGAGVGPAWGYAKGKMAEIHPDLLRQISEEAENIPIKHEKISNIDTKSIMQGLADKVLDFRRKKIADYVENPENWYKPLYPAIGNLLNLQFPKKLTDEEKGYFHDKDISKDESNARENELTALTLKTFIEDNSLNVDYTVFKPASTKVEEEEDIEYTDDEDEAVGDGDMVDESQYRLIDDTGKVFGCSVADIIDQFGICLLEENRVCGIDTRKLKKTNYNNIVEYLSEHEYKEGDGDYYEVALLKPGKILNRTGAFVSGVDYSTLEKLYRGKI